MEASGYQTYVTTTKERSISNHQESPLISSQFRRRKNHVRWQLSQHLGMIMSMSVWASLRSTQTNSFHNQQSRETIGFWYCIGLPWSRFQARLSHLTSTTYHERVQTPPYTPSTTLIRLSTKYRQIPTHAAYTQSTRTQDPIFNTLWHSLVHEKTDSTRIEGSASRAVLTHSMFTLLMSKSSESQFDGLPTSNVPVHLHSTAYLNWVEATGARAANRYQSPSSSFLGGRECSMCSTWLGRSLYSCVEGISQSGT